MKTINDLKKWHYKNFEWYDENNTVAKVLWTEENRDGDGVVECSIHEDIEKTTIDGIEYTHLRYIYGEGLVITDDTQRYTIKVSSLKGENTIKEKNENKSEAKNTNSNVNIKINPAHTYIFKNTIHSIHRFDDNTIIVLNNQKYKITLNHFENLSDEDIEAMYGGFAIDDKVLRELYATNYVYNFEKIN